MARPKSDGDGVKSSWQLVASDVPQGSVLGPLLWMRSRHPQFAGDMKLGGSADLLEARKMLHRDLSRIGPWAEANCMGTCITPMS